MVGKRERESLQAQYPDFPWAGSGCDHSIAKQPAKQAAKQERRTDSERDRWGQKRFLLVGLVGELARRAIAHAKQ